MIWLQPLPRGRKCRTLFECYRDAATTHDREACCQFEEVCDFPGGIADSAVTSKRGVIASGSYDVVVVVEQGLCPVCWDRPYCAVEYQEDGACGYVCSVQPNLDPALIL
jgi:hypothetical protein